MDALSSLLLATALRLAGIWVVFLSPHGHGGR